MKRGLALALLAGLGFAAAARAQLPLPLGLQELVNVSLVGDQDEASVAVDGQGGYIVVWRDSVVDGSLSAILARRFRLRTGQPLTGEILINLTVLGDQRNPAVAIAADGHFVVVWESPDGSGVGLKGSLRAPNGAAIVQEFPINETATGAQRRPAVAMHPDGAFLVTWQSDQAIALEGTAGENIFGRFYPTTFPADPPSDELVLNVGFVGDQEQPAVAALAGNNGWLVGWQGPVGPSQVPSILVRPLANNGTGPTEAPANSSATAVQRAHIALASNAQGEGVAVWEAQEALATPHRDIFARRLDLGAPIGAEEPVNLSVDLDEREPAVAIDGRGGFVTTWVRAGSGFSELSDESPRAPEGSPIVIQGRRKSGGGGFAELDGALADNSGIVEGAPPPDGEFQVNSSGADFAALAIAAQPTGNFVVVWQGTDAADPNGNGTFMRRFADAVFADGFETGGFVHWDDVSP